MTKRAAFVIGATGGLGEACAHALARDAADALSDHRSV